MKRKNLYYYILQESRGTVGGRFNYDLLIEQIVDMFLKKDYNLNQYVYSLEKENKLDLFTQNDKSSLIQYYPDWLEDVELKLFSTEQNDGKTYGIYFPNRSKYENGKLSISIAINLRLIILATYDLVNKEVDGKKISVSLGVPNLFRNMCIKTLNHEFKHAFDDWITKAKNAIPRQNHYDGVLNKISKSYNIGDFWKDLFSYTTYSLSVREMSAFQQEYLIFYKDHPLGMYYIMLLKDRFKSQDNLFKYLQSVSKKEYEIDFHEKMCKEALNIDKRMEEFQLDVLYRNKYFELFRKISNALREVENLSDIELEEIVKACEESYRYIFGKICNISNNKMKLIKMLKDFQNKTYLYLSKRILNRVFK